MKIAFPAEFLVDVKWEKQYFIPQLGGVVTSWGFTDHEEFDGLRNMLEAMGYIRIQRRWWNGDTVTKEFTFNDEDFKVGDQFPCATALEVRYSVNQKKRSSIGM